MLKDVCSKLLLKGDYYFDLNEKAISFLSKQLLTQYILKVDNYEFYGYN